MKIKKIWTMTILAMLVIGIFLISGCEQESKEKPVISRPTTLATDQPTEQASVEQPTEEPEIIGCSFSGVWDTAWGDMTLTQTGTSVTGTYAHDGGKITGTVDGATLTGKWSEKPSYSEPNDAGDIEFKLSEDCKSIDGNWRYGSDGGWGGEWDSTLIKSTPQPDITPETEQPTKKILTEQSIFQLIEGTWEIAPNKRASTGSIIFNDGRYDMNEKFHDGSGVGTKGEYNLNGYVDPTQIDLCLDKCGGDGSEWTTRFGIIRVLSNEKLEIHTSPTDKHPEGFSDDTSDEYTMILTRT